MIGSGAGALRCSIVIEHKQPRLTLCDGGPQAAHLVLAFQAEGGEVEQVDREAVRARGPGGSPAPRSGRADRRGGPRRRRKARARAAARGARGPDRRRRRRSRRRGRSSRVWGPRRAARRRRPARDPRSAICDRRGGPGRWRPGGQETARKAQLDVNRGNRERDEPLGKKPRHQARRGRVAQRRLVETERGVGPLVAEAMLVGRLEEARSTLARRMSSV